MKGLDTNILVRLLVADDAAQTRRVASLLESAEGAGEVFYVSSLVLLELAWVLESAYACTREEVLDAFEQLAAMAVLRIENLDAVHRAISFARKGRQDVADLLIACCSEAGGCTSVLTLDKRAARHTLFEQL